MLVVGREVGESVVILVPPSAQATVIIVKLQQANGGIRPNGRIAFQADRSVEIARAELVSKDPRGPAEELHGAALRNIARPPAGSK